MTLCIAADSRLALSSNVNVGFQPTIHYESSSLNITLSSDLELNIQYIPHGDEIGKRILRNF